MVKDKNTMNVVFRVTLLTLAACFIYAMNNGIRNNYGIMLNSIIDNSGIPLTSVSFVLAVGQLVFGLVQPAFGITAAKKGNIFVLISGIGLMLAGLLLTPYCKSIVSLMLCLGIILPAGTGALFFGVIMGTIIPKIPPKSVPVVSGIVGASIGIGNIVFSPVINSLIITGGLKYGMHILAILVLLMLPVALLMGKNVKKQVSQTTGAISQSTLKSQINIKVLFQTAFKSKTYINLIIGFGLCGFHMALLANHLPTQIKSYGISSEAVAYAFSLFGITTIIGSVLSGSLCSKFKMKNVLGLTYGLRLITILLFLLLPKTLFNVTLFTALLGFSGHSSVPPTSAIINRTFEAVSFATLFGFVLLVHQIGAFFGAWFGGICFNIMGSYTAIWVVNIIFMAVASAVSFAIKES